MVSPPFQGAGRFNAKHQTRGGKNASRKNDAVIRRLSFKSRIELIPVQESEAWAPKGGERIVLISVFSVKTPVFLCV